MRASARLDAVMDVTERHAIDLGAMVGEALADHVALAESRVIDLGLAALQDTPVAAPSLARASVPRTPTSRAAG